LSRLASFAPALNAAQSANRNISQQRDDRRPSTSLGTGTGKVQRCHEADPIANRLLALVQTLKRTEHGLILAIDGVPSAAGYAVMSDLVIGDTNGGQVCEDGHCSPTFWRHSKSVPPEKNAGDCLLAFIL